MVYMGVKYVYFGGNTVYMGEQYGQYRCQICLCGC
jgi:hypothetical protein